MSYLLICIGFIFLVKGAGFLVDGASSIAWRLRISDLVIGLTVVAFGTSAPELFVNIVASFKGNAGIAIGNILGSNIANILLVLGIAAIIYPLSVARGAVWREIPLGLFAALLFGVLANDYFMHKSSVVAITRVDSIILLSFFLMFLLYSFKSARTSEKDAEVTLRKQYGFGSAFFLIIVGLVGLSIGGTWIVNGAEDIARTFGVSDTFIGLTVVAIGTSLPELATSVVAVIKKQPAIALGNVVGSNIFNILFVLGISALIKPLPFQATNNIDVGVMVVAHILLFTAMFTGGRRMLDRWEGIVFVGLYIGYLSFLVMYA
ncbi:MAG: calcium/sodium antiporter [Candidatus Omnitrophica bacterium]|nr:calcium/sodium antiporter [Candidatus Omnitrophota bacterium]